ncbi:tape measure protein [Chromobacterium phragmitis]|uniref:tape measure protein n=1 Tax=Chromobacterium phragmitis TaxID=2202141 RepID=UPI00387837D1
MDVATLVLHADATGLRDGERALDSFQRKGEQAERSILRFADSATRGFSQARSAALSMVAAYAGINSATELIRLADAWTMISARLEAVTGSTQRAIEAQRELFDMSQRTQTNFQSNAALFARTSQAMSDMGKSYADTVKLTQAVGQGLAIGGAGTQESSSVMLQLSQALGSGVLQGDEFRSLMENAPYLMQKLADAIGVPKGELKKLSSEGKLTSEVIANALLTASDKIAKDAEKIPQTASRGMQYLTNSFGKFIDDANRSSGASAALGNAAKQLADNLDGVVTAAELVATAVGVKYASGAAAAAQASVERFMASIQAAKGDAEASQAALRRAQAEKTAAMFQLDSARASKERAAAALASAATDRERIALMASLSAGEARQAEQSGAIAAAKARLAAAEQAATAATLEHSAAEAARQGELIKTTASFDRLARAEAAVAATGAEVVAASRSIVVEQQRVADSNGRAAAMANALTMADERLAKAEATVAEAATVQTAAVARAGEVSAAATAAANNLAAAQARSSIVARGFGTAIGALGGPVGLAIMGFALLATQVDLFSSAAERAAEKGVNAINKIRAAFAEGNVVEAKKPRDELFLDSDQADKRVADLEARLASLRARGGFGGGPRAAQMGQDGASISELEEMIVQARRNAAAIRGQAIKADAAYREAKAERERIDDQSDPTVLARSVTGKYLSDLKNASAARRMASEIDAENKAYAEALKGAASAEEKAKLLAIHEENMVTIRDRFSRKSHGKGAGGLSRGESGIAGLEADIRSLSQMIDQYSQLGSAAQKLTEGEKQLNKLRAQRVELANKPNAGLTEKGLADRGKELADLDKQIQLAQKKVSLEKSVRGLENFYSDMEKSQSGIRAADAYLKRLDQIGIKVDKLTEAEKDLLDLRAERETLQAAPAPADKDESKARQQRLAALDDQINQKQRLVGLESDGRRGLAARKYTDEIQRQIAVMGLGSAARERYLFSLQLEESQIASTSAEYQQLMALYDEHVARSRDFVIGWDAAMADYLDSTSNNAKAAGAVFNAMTSSMEAGLIQFFETGKLGWKEFTVSVLREINKIMAAKAAAGLLSSVGGWLSSGTGGWMGAAAGMIGGGATQIAAPIVDGTLGPGRAFGGPVYPNTLHPVNERGMPELLMYGGSQFLMMPGQGGHVTPLMPATGGGGRPADGGVRIEQTNIFNGDKQESQGSGAASFERMMAGLAQPMRAVAKQVIQAEMRPGGDIYRGLGRG